MANNLTKPTGSVGTCSWRTTIRRSSPRGWSNRGNRWTASRTLSTGPCSILNKGMEEKHQLLGQDVSARERCAHFPPSCPEQQSKSVKQAHLPRLLTFHKLWTDLPTGQLSRSEVYRKNEIEISLIATDVSHALAIIHFPYRTKLEIQHISNALSVLFSR